MPWYVFVATYVIGWMATFRTVWLRFTDARKRWLGPAMERAKKVDMRHGVGYWSSSEVNSLGKIHRERIFVEKWQTVGLAFAWPGLLLFLIGKFFMFPRGVRTKYDREQELIKRQEETEAELAKAQALLDQEGIRY